MLLKPESTLREGRYKIEKILGNGGFGITYLALQNVTITGEIGTIQTTIRVAIKEFFMKDLCNRDSQTSHVSVPSVGSRELVERFKQKFIKEAQNIARLNHDHIIKVLDVFEENGTAYYVMEHIEGGSLSEHIDQCGALAPAEALHYINQIADALKYIHSKKVNHLDVKPSNILLKEGAVSVLIDFGLAKQYDNSGEQTSSTPVGISKGYAPMEQYKAGGVSSFAPSTDIYSLGATLYKLVTGKTPPEAYDLFDSGLPELPEELSVDVKLAITLSMRPSRNSRPQTIDDFLTILRGREDHDKTELMQTPEPKEEDVKEVPEVKPPIMKIISGDDADDKTEISKPKPVESKPTAEDTILSQPKAEKFKKVTPKPVAQKPIETKPTKAHNKSIFKTFVWANIGLSILLLIGLIYLSFSTTYHRFLILSLIASDIVLVYLIWLRWRIVIPPRDKKRNISEWQSPVSLHTTIWMSVIILLFNVLFFNVLWLTIDRLRCNEDLRWMDIADTYDTYHQFGIILLLILPIIMALKIIIKRGGQSSQWKRLLAMGVEIVCTIVITRCLYYAIPSYLFY